MKRKVVIIGCARSGIGAAKLAQKKGYDVTLYDGKTMESFKEEVRVAISNLEREGVQCVFGEQLNIDLYDLIIVSPGVPLDIPFLEEAQVADKPIIGEFEFAYSFCQAPVAAITGTNGKTTTTALVGQIIKAYNKDTYVVGNIGRAFSEDVLAVPSTGVVVAEVSSFQLETTETFKPKVSAILNITPDHLNRHKTMANYCEAKYRIAYKQTEKDMLILNANDSYKDEAASKTRARIIWFDSEKEVSFGTYAINDMIYENMSGDTNCLCHMNELKIVGKHNVENILAAVAITKAMGVPNTIIVDVLKKFKGVEHRLEYVATKGGVDFYNDSKATNVGAAIPGLLSMYKPIRLIAGGMDKETSFEEWTQYFEGRVAKVYVIGETKQQIIDTCHKQGFMAIEPCDKLEQAIKKAYEESSSGEVILLSPACASWDMFESYEQRGDLFKEVTNQLEG